MLFYLKGRLRRVLSVMLLLATVVVAAADGNTEERPLKVGIIAPLSGAVAAWGRSVQSAIELANSESSKPAELFFEDEESCSNAKALTAFRALTSQKKIDLLIASCLGGARVIAPLAKAQSLPFIISGRSSTEFQRAHPNALSWLTLLNYEGQAIGEFAKSRTWRRAAAIVSSEYFGLQFAEAVRTGLQTFAPTVELEVKEAEFDATPSSAEVVSLLSRKPDVFFLMLSEPAAAAVVRQLRAMRYSGDIVMQSSMLQTYDSGARARFRGALQQKFEIDSVQFARLQQLLSQRLGQEVADDFVFSYDGFTAVLAEANACTALNAGSLEDCMSQRLRNEVWRTGASGAFRFMRDGSTERPMVFKSITDDGFDPVPVRDDTK
jgi:branched-chain amino acid transport system substrate-binding protein